MRDEIVSWMKLANTVIALGALFGLASFGCQYDAATDACYAYVETAGARLAECGVVPTAAEGERAILVDLDSRGLDCDNSPTRLTDETCFYEQCIPELEVMDCATLEVPDSCRDKILYRSR